MNTKKIIEHFPENYEKMCYMEPFGGTGKILLTKAKSDQEVYNDFNENNFLLFQTLRDEPKELIFPNKIVKNKLLSKKMSERIKDVYILNQKPMFIIPCFNNENTLIFCDIPKKFPQEQYSKLVELLNNSFSKVIVTGNIIPKLFKEKKRENKNSIPPQIIKQSPPKWEKINSPCLILKNYK